MECKYCKKILSSVSSLNFHQRKTKHCLKIQGKDIKGDLICLCGKDFHSKHHLTNHMEICRLNNEQISNIYKENAMYKERNNLLLQKIEDLEKDKKEYKDLVRLSIVKKNCEDGEYEYTSEISDNNELIDEIDIQNNKTYKQLQQENITHKIRIKFLENKYFKKHSRIIIREKNVIYILTTNSLQKEGRYIFGKAVDLTNRLSTYNKTDEHQIVYRQSCPDEDSMSVVETMVFQKLKKYREQANRERFILPEECDINMFINTVKECIKFVS
jgi:hypothetical protein